LQPLSYATALSIRTDHPLPPLGALRTFDAVARRLNIAQAARELSVTPAAIRLGMRTLEQHLGVRLFERTTSGLVLTDLGSTYHSAIRDSFRTVAEATTRIMGGSKMLRLSVTPSIASRWLIARISHWIHAHPELSVSISTSLRVVDFERESVDAAIRFGRGQWPELYCRALTKPRLIAVASPSLVGNNRLLDAQVTAWPMISVSTVPHEWDEWCTQARVARNRTSRSLVVDTVQLGLQAAEAGLGIALARPLLVAEALREGTLCCPFQTVAQSDNTYFFAALPQAMTKQPLKAFAAWLFLEAGINSEVIGTDDTMLA
jgi:LysR family transcriptional regulator, glycine cleavage system transcriptional activator